MYVKILHLLKDLYSVIIASDQRRPDDGDLRNVSNVGESIDLEEQSGTLSTVLCGCSTPHPASLTESCTHPRIPTLHHPQHPQY